jgi:hypothetical protein
MELEKVFTYLLYSVLSLQNTLSRFGAEAELALFSL